MLGISVDSDTALYSWARDAAFPFLMVSDSGQVIGKLYGSTRNTIDVRNLFVVGPDGRITHRMSPFNVLSQDAYAELKKAVDDAAGTTAGSATPP